MSAEKFRLCMFLTIFCFLAFMVYVFWGWSQNGRYQYFEFNNIHGFSQMVFDTRTTDFSGVMTANEGKGWIANRGNMLRLVEDTEHGAFRTK